MAPVRYQANLTAAFIGLIHLFTHPLQPVVRYAEDTDPVASRVSSNVSSLQESSDRRQSAPGYWMRVSAFATTAIGLALAGCAGLTPQVEAPPPPAPPVAEAFAVAKSHFDDGQQMSLRERQRADAIARLELVIDEDDAMRGGDTGLPGRRYDNLWDRIRAGFAMPELNSPLVAQKERFYLERRDYLQRMLQRGGSYLFHIVEEIEKRNMPTELALLPFVESAMNPTAVSPAQASGLWQFIPSTGRAYNLQQDWWVDNRRDVVKSTQAALEYLQKIYEMQGRDWFLALASYNWGEGAVARAIRNNQARNRPTDYLSLNMPNETRQYVPKLIALKNILMRTDELGLALPPLPNRPFFVTIEKTRPIDLSLAAEFAGMSVEEFLELNPAHNRPVIAASRNNEIKLPADRLDSFLEAVERHIAAGKPFATWQPYTLKAGETLEAVAARNGIAAAELRRANGVRPSVRVIAGTRLLVPNQPVQDDRRVEDFQGPRIVELAEQRPVFHSVAAGETFATIARRHKVTVAQLRKLNPTIEGEPAKGVRLVIRPGGTQTIVTTENGQREVSEVPRPTPSATSAQTTTSTPATPTPTAAAKPATPDPKPVTSATAPAPAAAQATKPASPQASAAPQSAAKPATSSQTPATAVATAPQTAKPAAAQTSPANSKGTSTDSKPAAPQTTPANTKGAASDSKPAAPQQSAGGTPSGAPTQPQKAANPPANAVPPAAPSQMPPVQAAPAESDPSRTGPRRASTTPPAQTPAPAKPSPDRST